MHYKTIVLDLIEQRPELHQQLMLSRTMPQLLHRLTIALATCHRQWMAALQARPSRNPTQLSQTAMEFALQELLDSLQPESPADDAEPLSLEAAIEFIRRHTPRAF